MRGTVVGLMALLALVAGTGWVAQTAEPTMESAAAAYSEWIDAMVEFTRGVEIDEKGMRAFLDHWGALNELDVVESDDEDAAEFTESLHEALTDPRYRSWAEGRELEPKKFLQTSMRIMSLFMVQQTEGQRALAAQEWKDYSAVVEEQCAHVDEQTCRQMRQGLADSKAMGEAMQKTLAKLPPPSAQEQALLERYAAEVEALMEGDDDDYEDEDYYEDDDSNDDDDNS